MEKQQIRVTCACQFKWLHIQNLENDEGCLMFRKKFNVQLHVLIGALNYSFKFVIGKLGLRS